jgi:hypothetical protein
MDLCPDEYVLSGYHAGRSNKDEREFVSAHIARCAKCAELLKETAEIERSLMIRQVSLYVLKGLFARRWAILAVVFFILSFAVRKYFIQLTAAFIVFAVKWAVSRQTATGNVVAIFNERGGSQEKDRAGAFSIPLERASSGKCLKK